jgi:tRNA(Arg) A34 adenosine deaminase TadA
MCFAAINWAQIRRITFGTTVRDVKRLGFNELVVSNQRLKTLGGARVELVSGFMRDECQKLLDDWKTDVLGLAVPGLWFRDP